MDNLRKRGETTRILTVFCVQKQRRQYKLHSDGKKSSMTQGKIDSLNALGFIWVARSTGADEYSDDEARDEAKIEEPKDVNN